eukprot:Em0008g786a
MATSTQTTVKVEQLSPLVDEGDLKLASGNSSCICSVKINATQCAFNFAYVNYSTMRDAQEAVTHTVKVDQLPLHVSEEDLMAAFSTYGNVVSTKINTTQTALNYAYVNYTNQESVLGVTKHLNGATLWGKPIVVKVHRPENGQSRCENSELHQSFSGQSYTVKVEQIPHHVTQEMLSEIFGSCGTLESAKEAVQKWNGSKVWGSIIAVKIHNASGKECVLIEPDTKTPVVQILPKMQRDEKYTLIIDHLSGLITEEELCNLFHKHGELRGLKLFETQTAFNYAYVDYSNIEDAEMAVRELDGAEQYGVAMEVRLFTSSNKSRRLMDEDAACQDQTDIFYGHQCTLNVECLPKSVQDRDLWDTFTPFGLVTSAKLIVTETEFNSAQIEYAELEDAEAAVHELDGSTVFSDSSPICVKIDTALCTSAATLAEADFTGIASFYRNTAYQLQFTNSAQHSTVKVSLSNKPGTNISINGEDLQDIFGRCGKIQCLPVINQGNPPYAYINFESPIGAQAACALNGLAVMEHLLQVKLVTKQTETLDIKNVPCDPLVCKLMFSHFKADVEAVRQDVIVQLHRSKSAIKLTVSGQVDSLDPAISDLICELEKLVVETKCELHQVDPIAAALLDITGQYCVEARVSGTDLISKKVVLVSIQQGTPEWNEVTDLFGKTLVASRITKLERIQNKWLWERFVFAKQRMVEKNKGQVKEMKLFHGTKNTRPKEIFKSEQGFDPRYSSQGMWGTGAYFAVDAKYSDNYSHISGIFKQMILARVLTGDTCRCAPDSSLKMPPLKPCLKVQGAFENERYDSVSGHTRGSDIFVIYDNEKAYPAYLITYV